ncbi:Hypothetical_protein [Hexamita inflata]|uniref:Hypothetical_protein n=1 Tax=Hexamita inflata TaxID=28002 RepID=A0AA86QAQ6_9EUKA|nr:Hypothetical protein HINF_LOCUS36280 [Hexamita inflata]
MNVVPGKSAIQKRQNQDLKYKNIQRRKQSNSYEVELQAISENSEEEPINYQMQQSIKTKMSPIPSNNHSYNIFWDISSIQEIKLMNIQNQNGKRKIESIIIQTSNSNSTYGSQDTIDDDDDDIFSLIL